MMTTNDHDAVLKLLLDENADGHTSLSLANFDGHEAVVILLLNKNANVESKAILLSYAAENGHEAVAGSEPAV